MESKIDMLFDELVPSCGNAPTVAGEIVRAFCRISYRCFNDGDHIGVGYGNETCNAAARYLMRRCPDSYNAIRKMWGTYSDSVYDRELEALERIVIEYIESHPELKETENTEDMWDYFDKIEDRDYYDDDEEEDW